LIPKYDIEFVEADTPITEPVTKFGGQPVWIVGPEWPLSQQTGGQMRFICQIALDPELLGVPPGKVAYVFMTQPSDGEYVDGTWEPEGGENAVIVQPSTEVPYGGLIQTVSSATGPTLFASADTTAREYAVRLTSAEEPKLPTDDQAAAMTEEEYNAYADLPSVSKIGGQPWWVQGEEFPEGGPWKFFLQLEMMEAPFYVNFGDAGAGYAFVSHDGEEGRFLWQCA
jgi:hypothetical protein